MVFMDELTQMLLVDQFIYMLGNPKADPVIEPASWDVWRAIIDPRYEDAWVTEVRDKLITDGVEIRSAYTAQEGEHHAHVIGVGEDAERLIVQGLGQAVDVNLGTVTHNSGTGVIIFIGSSTKPTVRALDILVRTILYSNTRWFIINGCDDPHFASASAVIDHKDVFPLTVTQYRRMVYWSFTQQQNFKIIPLLPPPTGKPIVIASTKSIVGRVPNPETRTFTDLDQKLPGGLNGVSEE